MTYINIADLLIRRDGFPASMTYPTPYAPSKTAKHSMNRINLTSVTVLLGASIACSGCAERLDQNVLQAAAASANFAGTSQVRILAATTRQLSSTPGEMFNGRRATKVSYASLTISIPPDSNRKIGEIQWPANPPGNPQHDFVTTEADRISRHDFDNDLDQEIHQTNRHNVLIFVHGFNNRFDEAVYRFAQIVHDSGAPGIPVLFSWPSRGEIKLRAYTYDRDSANYSRDALARLIDEIGSDRRVKEVNIVAHSMGNWLTLEALRTISIRNKKYPGKIRNVLLVAPDVDVDVFRTEIHRVASPKLRIAVFVSRDDKALALSKTIWGGVPRLGEIDPNAEPYRSEFAQDHIDAFDLTHLKSIGGSAHDRAFQDVTTVMIMMKKRFGENQQIAAH